MKRQFIIPTKAWLIHAFVFLFPFIFTIQAQNVWTEYFNYGTGNLLSNQENWEMLSSGNDVLHITDGLSFPGYPGSNQGYAVRLENDGAAECTAFPAIESGNIYMAFLARIKASSKDQYFIHLWDGNLPFWNGGTDRNFLYNGRIYGSADGKNVGLSFGDNSKRVMTIGETIDPEKVYLFVLKYEIVSGNNNDKVSLFLFDSMPDAEPDSPLIGPLSDANKGDIIPAGLGIRPGYEGQDIVIGGIRVASSWDEAVKGKSSGTIIRTTTTTDINVSTGKLIVTSKQEELISIYTTEGKLIEQLKNKPGTHIYTPALTPGIYIIKSKNKTFKIKW